jgi:hypothetical protein
MSAAHAFVHCSFATYENSVPLNEARSRFYFIDLLGVLGPPVSVWLLFEMF